MIHSQLMNKLKSIIFDESHIDQNIMILSGKPITMKNDFIFSIASHISSSKSQIHYFDINSQLRPTYPLLNLKTEKENAIKIYRLYNIETTEKILDYLCYRSENNNAIIILDSILLNGRKINLRNLELDAIYLFSLLNKFCKKTNGKVIIIIHTNLNVQALSKLSFFEEIKDNINALISLLQHDNDRIILDVYKYPFSEISTYRITTKQMSEY